MMGMASAARRIRSFFLWDESFSRYYVIAQPTQNTVMKKIRFSEQFQIFGNFLDFQKNFRFLKSDLRLDTWDTGYISDNWEQQYEQLHCDLWIQSDGDSIRNSCDVILTERPHGLLEIITTWSDYNMIKESRGNTQEICYNTWYLVEHLRYVATRGMRLQCTWQLRKPVTEESTTLEGKERKLKCIGRPIGSCRAQLFVACTAWAYIKEAVG